MDIDILSILFNIILLCTIIASIIAFFFLVIALIAHAYVFNKARKAKAPKTEFGISDPHYAMEDTEGITEEDPIYSSKFSVYEQINYTANPYIVMLLALFAVRYSPFLVRKKFGKMFLYFHRLCAIAVLSYPSFQEIFFRFGMFFFQFRMGIREQNARPT